MSSRQSTVVPWYKPEQFYKVYESLYSPDVTEKRWAVDQISVWETRCHPSLPTAIEATVVIVRAIIQDVLFENEASLCQERDIQMFYAMALVRFVNLTIELDQNSRKKIPLAVIAEKRDIPSWIVNLRHNATHSFCPSLPVLRIGSQSALHYLNKSFWMPEAGRLHGLVKTPYIDDGAIIYVINQYLKVQYDRRWEMADETAARAEIAVILKNIRLFIKKYRERFVEILVQPGLFIFAEDDLRCLLQPEDPFLDDDEVIELPEIVESFWLPVLKTIHKHSLIPDFVELLLLTENPSPISAKLAVSWVSQIVSCAALSLHPTSPLTRLFKRQGVMFNWHRLLYACSRHPSKYTPYLFPQIACNMNCSKRWFNKVMYSVAIYQGQAVDNNLSLSDRKGQLFTVKEVKIRKAAEDLVRNKNSVASEENLWSLTQEDDMDFSSLPIGAVINEVDEDQEDEVLAENVSFIEEEQDCEDTFIITNESDSGEMGVRNVTVDNSFQDEATIDVDHMIYQRRMQI